MKKKNEFNYFDEFAKFAKYAIDEVEELKKYIFDFNQANSEVEMQKIHEIENTADKNLHELKNFLLKDFLPPIDRDDILELANKLDDFIDFIDEIIIDINIYNMVEVTEDIKNLINLLEDATKILYDLIIEFKNLKKIKEIKDKVVEVNKIEGQADILYINAIRDLYKNKKDAVEIIKWCNIYKTIEKCFDACESVANCVDDVLLKNT